MTELCPCCKQKAERVIRTRTPLGYGVLFVHGYEKHKQGLVAYGHFYRFGSKEYLAWEARS